MEHPVAIILYVVAITSLANFVLMYLDKRAAQQGSWRVPERRILFWAFVGGGLGALAAQRAFRHKTKKEPFVTLLKAALVFNVISAGALMVPALREGAFDLLKAALNLLN